MGEERGEWDRSRGSVRMGGEMRGIRVREVVVLGKWLFDVTFRNMGIGLEVSL